MKRARKTDELFIVLSGLRDEPSDQRLWRTLYQHIWPFVIAVAFRRLKEKRAAEDVAQEVLLRLMQSQPFKSIKDGSEFKAYVWKMTINAANSYWRANQRSADQDSPWRLNPSDYLAEPSINADDYLILKEAVSLVLDKLDSQDSKLLDLLSAGQSLGQAAKDLGISYSNAAIRLHRAKLTIRNLLISND